MTLRQHFFW